MKKRFSALFLLLALGLYAAQTPAVSPPEKSQTGQASGTYKAFFALAKSGDLDAQALLGEMYLDGIGVEKDAQKAFFWLSKAAKRNDPQAQYLLGSMYENGIYVTADMQRAVKWYTESAKQGDVMAQYTLALIYKDGKGEIAQDLNKAMHWMKMVEKQKDKLVKMAMR